MIHTGNGVAWLVGFWVLMLTTEAFGGAWTLRKNAYYIELFSQYFWNTDDFNVSGRRVSKPNNGHFNELREEIKVEAGLLSNRFNVLFALPWEIAHFKEWKAVAR